MDAICNLPSPDLELLIFSELSLPSNNPQSDQLGFMQEGKVDDGTLDYVHYQIEWRVKLNNCVVAKDTEQDLALLPRSYWERIKNAAGNILWRKIAHNRRVRLDDTNLANLYRLGKKLRI